MQQASCLLVYFLQVLKALQETASSMLDFVLFITGDNSGDEPEPEQIPKGFRVEVDINAYEDQGGISRMERGDDAGHVDARRVSVFKSDHLQDFPGQADRGWALRTLQACCLSIGMLLSLAGGVETSTKLLVALPGLCSWLCHRRHMEKAVALREQVAPVESLISALYVMQMLHTSGGAVTDTCKAVLQKPEVFTVMCLCGITTMKHCQEHIHTPGTFWQMTLSSQVVVTCELISATIRNQREDDRLSAEQLYMQLHKCGINDSSVALLPSIVAASNALQCALAVTMPDHASALRNAGDAAAVVDAIGAVADLTTAAISGVSDFKGSNILQPLCNAFGALRVSVEFVMMSHSGEYGHLIQGLVSAGAQESTCWQSAPDTALLACVGKGSDVCSIVERCCSICASITSTLETMPPLAAAVRKATWIGQYLKEETDLLPLLKALDEDGTSVSLGHALQMIAIVMRS